MAIFGRPFVKRFTLCYRTVVCLYVCLSVLFVRNVDVLWPNGYMDKDGTWHAGRPRPWPHCVRWGARLGIEVRLGPGHIVPGGDPAALTKSGHSPQFLAHIVVKRLDGSRCHLVWR